MLYCRIVIIVFLLAMPVFAGMPTANDLIGLWDGAPPKGGSLQIDIKNVDSSGVITATANVRAGGGGGRPVHMTIAGERGEKEGHSTFSSLTHASDRLPK